MQVFGTLRGKKSLITRFNLVPTENLIEEVDVDESEKFIQLLDKLRPNFVINCTGITIRNADHLNSEKNYRINSFFPRILSLWCQNNQARLITFSTDCVFDGTKGNYSEADFPTELSIYGQSKFLGEVTDENSLTLRVSVIGREIFGKTELLEWFLAHKNKIVQGYSEVFYSGLTTNFLAQEVVRIIKSYPTLSGRYQIACEKISKFELLSLVNKIFDNRTEIIKNSSKKADKSLNCDKYISMTKFVKPEWEVMLTEMRNDQFRYERV